MLNKPNYLRGAYLGSSLFFFFMLISFVLIEINHPVDEMMQELLRFNRLLSQSVAEHRIALMYSFIRFHFHVSYQVKSLDRNYRLFGVDAKE